MGLGWIIQRFHRLELKMGRIWTMARDSALSTMLVWTLLGPELEKASSC